jgi:transmembrane sensor
MKEEISDIISKVLAGESSPEDELFLIDWLNEDTANSKNFSVYERLWNITHISRNRKKYDSNSAFLKFRLEIRKPKKVLIGRAYYKTLVSNSLKWAAIATILIVAGSLGSQLIFDKEQMTDQGNFEVIAAGGSRSNIVLVDGTSVWLNAGSRLTYTRGFGNYDRTVHLEGEGFFNVEKADIPFTVITSQLEIVALGTSFNVKSYPEESIIQTTLVSGSLLINRNNHKAEEKGLVLMPNQQITYYKDTRELMLTHEISEDKQKKKPVTKTEVPSPRIIMSRGVDPEIFTAWKDNRLIFDNEPFESIAVKLERRFGARIQIEDDKIRNTKFTGRFDEITIEQALSALRFASPFDYYIKQDTIFIASKK